MTKTTHSLLSTQRSKVICSTTIKSEFMRKYPENVAFRNKQSCELHRLTIVCPIHSTKQFSADAAEIIAGLDA
jgi:hypothetical protein